MPITITMPALSPTMTEGTLAKWLVKEGDRVASGDMLAEIETDKATMEMEAVEEGTIVRLLVADGTEAVPVNAPIAVLLEEGEDAAALEGYQPQGALQSAAVAAPAPAPAAIPAPVREVVADTVAAETVAAETVAPAAPAPAPTAAPVTAPAAVPAPIPAAATGVDGARIFASPLARRMAAQAGLDLAALSGSGPHGRIIKVDVETALASTPTTPAAAPSAPAAAVATADVSSSFEPAFELERLSAMRKTIARRMTEAKQTVPHFYLTVDCEVDNLLVLRADLNAKAGGDFKLSVNDFVIKAAALSLRKIPEVNSGYSDAGTKRYQSIDVAVAVAIDGGLITPVLRQADNKGLAHISSEMRALAEKAQAGKLQPEEYQGGTFTISNLGMFGIKQFDAVINPPQAAILAVGAGEQRPVVKDGALAVATVMSCTLSLDHRVLDGAIGARYLAAFKALIEDPMKMLL